jgi:thiopeptide-type bacteriocin biosynthesis protein
MGGKPFLMDNMFDNKQVAFLAQVFLRRPFFRAADYNPGKLKEVLVSNVFKNALWLASPEFYRELEKKNFDFDLLGRKERLTALKFYNRMSFRATPFGAFSAFGLVPWNAGDRLLQTKGADMRLHLLPSVEKELELLALQERCPETLLAVNPTLYRLTSGWRYTRYETEKNGKLSFYAYHLEYNAADAALLELLAAGPLSYVSVQNYLTEITDCEDCEALKHLERLLDEQVLLADSDLSLLLRSQSADDLPGWDYGEHLSLPLSSSANDWDGRSYYSGLEMKGLGGGVDQKWRAEILRALEALDLLAVIPQKESLDQFKKAFEEKFGERMVSLLEALDPDLGIVYDGLQQQEEHDLLQGLEFPGAHRRSDRLTWTPVHRMLMKVWLQNNRRGTYETVVLQPEDLAGLTSPDAPLPPSMVVLFTLVDKQLVLHSAGGVTANAITGRFSAFSDDFHHFCRDTATMEMQANPEILFAEILQLSHRQVDNINRRRQVYPYAIPLNTFPSVDGYLLPADLSIGIRAGELVLVHRPTGKRVIPRLPTAFNFHHNDMPLFRLLCDLQFQSVRAGFDFDPEKLFPGLDFYPRIAYGNTVLSLARWHLRKEDIAFLTQQPLSISRLHLFCREKGIPVSIAAGRGDQQLVFNLAQDDEALFFLESLHDASNSVIVEHPRSSPPDLKIDQGFNLQYVATLHHQNLVYHPLQKQQAIPGEPVRRNFPPGSEWVYMKIYCTHRSAEEILLHVLVPWLDSNRPRISQWFFVRFQDPDSHLRVRFRLARNDVKDVQYEFQALLAQEQHAELVQKAYFDTYQREIERYSAEMIDLVESVFHQGSEVVTRYLVDFQENNGQEELLWPVLHCYKMIKVFFDDDIGQVIALCQRVAALFLQEHGGEKKLKRSMDDRFRELRPGLTALAGGGYQLLQATTSAFGAVLRDLSAVCRADHPEMSGKLIADLVHMQINRIFSSGQRRHEAFIWHCMVKLAVTARENKKKVPSDSFVNGR